MFPRGVRIHSDQLWQRGEPWGAKSDQNFMDFAFSTQTDVVLRRRAKTLKSYRETNISHKVWWMYRVKIPHHLTHTPHPAQQQPMAQATGPMRVFLNTA